MQFATRLWRDERGVAAPLFGLMAFSMAALALAGVDMMRFQIIHSRVVAALDAAVLAGGRRLASPDWRDDARAFFWNNMQRDYLGGTVGELQITTGGTPQTGQTVSLSVDVAMPLLVAGFIDMASWDFTVDNQAIRRTRSEMEVVLAMDNTGSMSRDNKLQDMKTAAKRLVDILVGEDGDSTAGLYMGTVPFDTTVRTPGHHAWMDIPPNLVITRPWGPYNLLYVRDYRASDWGGCTEEVGGLGSWPLDAAPPSVRKLTIHTTQHRDVCLYRWGNTCVWQERLPVYDEGACITTPVNFLDGSRSRTKAAIDAMQANGSTAVAMGMLWGWRMLSPDWRGAGGWGHPTLPQNRANYLTKAVVLLTDGENDVRSGNPTGLGRTPTVSQLNSALATACRNAKAAGITVYSITFGTQVNDPAIRRLMQDCATDITHYFHAPSGESLNEAFETIAGSLSELRLVR